MMTMNNVTAPNTPEPACPSVPFSIRTSERPVRYSLEFQRRVVREYLSGETKNSIAQKYSITDNIVDNFLRRYREEVSQEMEQEGEYVRPLRRVNRYEKGFKIQCVRLVLSGGLIRDVAQRYGVSPTSVRDWTLKYGDEVSKELDLAPSYTVTAGPAPAEIRPPESKPTPPAPEEDLRRRNAQLAEENRVLRKAVAIFATAI